MARDTNGSASALPVVASICLRLIIVRSPPCERPDPGSIWFCLKPYPSGDDTATAFCETIRPRGGGERRAVHRRISLDFAVATARSPSRGQGGVRMGCGPALRREGRRQVR